MKMGLALAVLLSLVAIPTHADTLQPGGIAVALENAGTGQTEAIASSFLFDRTTQEVVPGTMAVSAAGPLGGFSFDGLTITAMQNPNPNTLVGEAFFYSFVWGDNGGDKLTYQLLNEFLDPNSEFPHWVYGFNWTGPKFDGYSFASFPSVTGVLLYPPPVATPEPSSLILLGTGLLGMIFIMRKRVKV